MSNETSTPENIKQIIDAREVAQAAYRLEYDPKDQTYSHVATIVLKGSGYTSHNYFSEEKGARELVWRIEQAKLGNLGTLITMTK